MKRIVKITELLVILAWVAFIFSAVTIPLPIAGEDTPFTIYDKIAHLFMFGILSFMLIYFLSKLKESKDVVNRKVFTFLESKTAIYVFSGIFSFLYAYFCEYIQTFLPSRSNEMLDLVFGVFGIILFSVLYYIYFDTKKKKLLLHICCAPCGAYVSQLLKEEFNITLYYFNPNIRNKKEVEKRLVEVNKLAKEFNLPVIVGRYSHKVWLKSIKGYEKEPEKGKRCDICFKGRLLSTVKKAKNKFDYFATTLTVSPHKNSKIINSIGKELEEKYKVKFLDRDFKKQDGYKKSVKLAEEFCFYRQSYCGCEFSFRESKKRKKK